MKYVNGYTGFDQWNKQLLAVIMETKVNDE